MNKDFFENKVADTQDVGKETASDAFEKNYRRYFEIGGIINEKDYQRALGKMVGSTFDRDDPRVRQVVDMARYSGIELSGSEDGFDPRVVLYVILRSDVELSDQRIFGEVLRMLGDADSLDKLIRAYPNISFKHEREK